ncbi:hypothetical protein FEM48_Zijuj01G0233100 [Ziziphus jujuba var. spinosa]|uniref:Bromo domain-containing protein n=1 Tax=Ziziphus jujuba var. spinosa TaxID=714518 RepID=A0A978W452_ZIZJJ|nr:hypothetical protein FEM48_Zijuj01G0233100 [Ziziphus jujuba var. spinosa]
MGQIVRRKKKGRPSKADLARRSGESPAAKEADIRRSLRRRNGRGRKADAKRLDSLPGTPSDPHSGIPLPDKKTLELMLDKLQKKDTYGVYAEPVDPEELPDYHDVIEHPMDFATVRKKLANGSYPTLEQFEDIQIPCNVGNTTQKLTGSDVFLICSNAMQYNAPETIYHKQARAIQELARKKFEKLRIEFESSEKEQKLAQKLKSNSLVKKPTKKPLCRTLQETVGSDFSSGATLATAADVHNSSNPMQAGGCERPGNTDGPVEGNLSLNDANVEKAEEMSSGKGLLSKLGRKPLVLEDRRGTYNISNQPVIRSESVFTTFECETKQLVAVGLHAEYSYARSLARFAATLGPVAWKVASQRIQQALPAGCKYGRGWVGEYEPLPTPVLMLENHTQKHPGLVMQVHTTGEMRKDDRSFKTPVPVKEQAFSGPTLEGRQSLFSPTRGPQSEGNPAMLGSAGLKSNTAVNAVHQQQNFQQNSQSRNFAELEKKVTKQVELNSLPSANQNSADHVVEKKFSRNAETAASKSRDTVSRRTNFPQAVPYKLPDANGVVTGGMPNGKGMNNSPDNRMNSPSDSAPNQMAKAAAYLPHGLDRSLNDPVLMKMLAEKTQKQQKSSDQSTFETQQIMPSVPSVRREDPIPNNAAAAAARAWMSVGAGAFKQPMENPTTPKSQISADSLYIPIREVRPQISQVRGDFPVSGAMQFQSEKNRFQVPAFLPVPQPVRFNEGHIQNRPIIFPQLAGADLSRFQMQSPWRGLSPQTQARQKQESLPPDLNIGFQSPGSPVKQSGVLVDSQQPDLALQL